MVCRIEDVDDLFKAFNGGKAADFTAEDLAEQVCTWLTWVRSIDGCILFLGRVTKHRAFLCQAGVRIAPVIAAQQAAWLQSELPNLK